MRKQSSKSVLSSKNIKTTKTMPESKKGSRVTKTNSCIKINSQNTDQNNNYNATMNKYNLQQLSEQLLAQLSVKQSQYLLDKPKISQDKNTSRQQSKTNRPINEKNSLLQSRKKKEVIGKMSIQTISIENTHEQFRKIKIKNQQLSKQNATLKEKCCQLQEVSLKDKQKIKNLIIRINQVKQGKGLTTQAKTIHPSTSLLPTYHLSNSGTAFSQKKRIQNPFVCDNAQCIQRKRYLQSQLYKQRISRDRLQLEKVEWQKNKQKLKMQYNQLLNEIKEIRDQQI